MRHVTFYHTETGMLNGVTLLVSDDSAVALNVKNHPGHEAIDHPQGSLLDHLSQRVDLDLVKAEDDAAATAWAAEKDRLRLQRTAGGEPGEDPPAPARTVASAKHVVDHQPPKPSADHEWDAATKRWKLTAAVQHRNAVRQRARMEIVHIERDLQPRALREAFLNVPGGVERLTELEAQIVKLRAQITTEGEAR